ncbi:MAG TPA: hypothetical protein VGC15_14540 [Acetobacteraceae bacterium]|jgi:hypothetical protein
MSLHKFGSGQKVDFSPSAFDGNAPRGSYIVVKQMPSETRDLQYRIKNARDGHERVVRESQLGQS